MVVSWIHALLSLFCLFDCNGMGIKSLSNLVIETVFFLNWIVAKTDLYSAFYLLNRVNHHLRRHRERHITHCAFR
jgi:hypothetical protein